MDESSIVSVLQEDLQNYKVKTQIRRKESQLHVLISRAEGDDLDYGAIYDIVKRRIDDFASNGMLDDANSLIVYGRLAGARHPEWQKAGEIKPPLPLIELDLDDLEDLGDIGNITFPIAASDLEISASKNLNLEQRLEQVGDRDDEYHSFKDTIANDLENAANLTVNDLDDPFDNNFLIQPPATIADLNSALANAVDSASNDFSADLSQEQAKFANSNFDLAALDLGDISLGSGKNTLEIEPLPDAIALPEIDNEITLGQELVNGGTSNGKLPDQYLNAGGNSGTASDFSTSDFSISATTVAMPRPLPPPPTKHRKTAKSSTDEHQTPELQKVKKPLPKLPIISLAFATGAIAILGVCGWLIWERSVQQNYIETARSLENNSLNPAKITQLDQLIASRNQIQTAIAQLQTIPNRPVSLYATAQSEIASLQPKLQAFDQRVNLEQTANKNLELGKSTTLEAAKLVLNPPHHSKIWKAAQAKRQEALKILEQVPADSLIYPDVQARIKTYRNELTQISKRVDIQQRAESVVTDIAPEAVNQLKQIKTKTADKTQFLNQCRPVLQRQIAAADAQRLGMSPENLNSYLCAYFWD